MYDDRMETICARLCLLSVLERNPDEPAPLTRSQTGEMLKNGILDGLVLRETGAESKDIISKARALLARASVVYRRLEAYGERGYHVLLPQDAAWPRGLKKLGSDMPLYLFAKGNLALLEDRLISVAGSRLISKQTREKADKIGRMLARAGMTIVSGGARGVDSVVQEAALEAGGRVVVIPAVTAAELMRSPVARRAINEGRMLVLFETPPDEPFSAQKALTRNHTIYALGDCAVVIASRKGKGGSWAGAKACLRGRWSPVYVLDDEGADFEGNRALLEMDALRMQIIEGKEREDLLMEGMNADTLMRFGLLREPTLFDWEEKIHAHTGQT